MKKILLAAILAASSLTGSAFADPLTIANFSFETAIDNNVDGVGNWTSFNALQNTFEYGAPYATNGTWVAYSNGSGALYQRLAAPIAAGAYTFQADIGTSLNSPTAFFDIYAWDGGNAYTLLGGTGAVAPTVGTVALNQTVAFTIPELSPYIGQTLQLQFVNTGIQSTYDNVRGDFVAVPEPSTYAMMVLSGLALLVFRRRRAA